MKNFSHLIGIPYEKLDCWGLAKVWYWEVLSIDLKHYYEEIPKDRSEAKNLIYSNMGDFKKVSSPEFGDILLIRIFGVESHIAIYIGNGRILHTSKPTGSIIEPLSKWEKTVTGIFRVENDKT